MHRVRCSSTVRGLPRREEGPSAGPAPLLRSPGWPPKAELVVGVWRIVDHALTQSLTYSSAVILSLLDRYMSGPMDWSPPVAFVAHSRPSAASCRQFANLLVELGLSRAEQPIAAGDLLDRNCARVFGRSGLASSTFSAVASVASVASGLGSLVAEIISCRAWPATACASSSGTIASSFLTGPLSIFTSDLMRIA